MVNIAFISNYFGIGGMERTFLSIAENLSKKNYSFHFINLAENHFQNRFHNCGKCFHSKDFSTVIKYLTDQKIDIVQTCNCDDGSYLAYLAGIKTIIERPDGFSSAFLSDKTPVSSIICSTNSVFKKAKTLYPEKHIELVYNGVDTNIFYNTGKNVNLLKALNLSHKDIIIGHCGRIAESKCLDQLINVFDKLSQKIDNCKLLILGDEFPHNCGYKNHLINKIKELHLDEKIIFCEATEQPEETMNLFDVAVLCSGSFKLPDGSYEVEGIPNSIMESMAIGIPAVATDSGETNLLVKNNENGFIVGVNEWDTFREKLEILITDPKLRQKMGASAQTHIRTNFSLKTMVERYKKIYTLTLNADFEKTYPDARIKMKDHFLDKEFNLLNESLHNKKILIIKSGNDALFAHLINNIKNISEHIDISTLTNKTNYNSIKNIYAKETFFVYDQSDSFSLKQMNKMLEKLNRKNFDYLFFLFNDLQGKDYKNVIEIVNSINSEKKIVFNKLLKMFLWNC